MEVLSSKPKEDAKAEIEAGPASETAEPTPEIKPEAAPTSAPGQEAAFPWGAPGRPSAPLDPLALFPADGKGISAAAQARAGMQDRALGTEMRPDALDLRDLGRIAPSAGAYRRRGCADPRGLPSREARAGAGADPGAGRGQARGERRAEAEEA